MKGIAIYEAKARFSELLAAVQAGEEFNITKHGKPVARLLAAKESADPDSGASQQRSVAETFKRLRELRKGVCLEGDIKAIIAEGRE
jgi:prevent-host-death family protein